MPTTPGGQRPLDNARAEADRLAGFPHVIGTLWAIAGSCAVRIADTLYDALTIGSGPDTRRAAHALHHAVRTERHTFRATPSPWAAHLHVGARGRAAGVPGPTAPFSVRPPGGRGRVGCRGAAVVDIVPPGEMGTAAQIWATAVKGLDCREIELDTPRCVGVARSR
ncbi:CHAT domain-containing protein [Kitasatospora sp. NPDC088346]|uniref:CHAT domain-containing protein n=1 Tax=Kitasatospora sp. NPDC088346 TaxID=3364073 RepID=UPI0038263549